MKNFKKVLALVLVLATLMGFATVAGAAYKDEKDINADYSEAVKVLDLIETMQGYPDGNFKPTATITREEAAKLIAIFDNKDADIKDYYTSINPFADEKGRWGESYVGYGYRAGIIAGMNATTFAPTANVTGTQFLKMALVTLGYDQEAEGFVGTSWAVNVLSLAKKLGLVDDLADGWKAEKALTREEAAQILLNTLKADTVEYGQEAKLANFKPTKVLLGNKVNAEGTSLDTTYEWSFNGKFYVTVAGAVKTGNKLYKDFDLTKAESTDAFYRPYTKWTYDNNKNKTVEVMKAPKATFTKEFSVCDLLVALGIKETDRDTQIAIDAYYYDGIDESSNTALRELINLSKSVEEYTGAYKYVAKTDSFEYDKAAKTVAWNHTTSTCADAKGAKAGAQGVLTQVFQVGKDDDGVKHYVVVSINTWLAEVTKVTKKVTSRDNHVKTDGAVELKAFTHDYKAAGGNEINENFYGYCYDAEHNYPHCQWLKQDYAQKTLTYDDPEGIEKGDYVLITYSWRENKNDEHEGVQSADVVEGKEGRLNGYKFGKVAENPSETRINGEYVKDSVHFHEGYNLSKSNEFGTYTFYYDAYGNVIGMFDVDNVSSWGVVDKAWMTFPEGDATLNAKVYNLAAELTTSTIKKFASVASYIDETAVGAYVDTDSFAYDVAVALKNLTNGESSQDFDRLYDHLFKVTADKDGKLTLKVAIDEDEANKKAVHPFGVHTAVATGSVAELNANQIKVVKGTPYLEIINNGGAADKSIVLTSKTQFLVHKMDGTYATYTGYKNVDSMIAHYAEVVYDEDYKAEKVASIVYLANDVYMTADKFVAYVGKSADRNGLELKDDGNLYFALTAYVNGEATEVYVTEADMQAYFTEKNESPATKTFHKGFYQFQYVEVDGDKIVKVLKDTDDFTGNDAALSNTAAVVYVNSEEIKVSGTNAGTYELAEKCGVYGIYKNKVVTDVTIDDFEKNDNVYFRLNDDDQVTALYLVLENND